ncbi:MULTISPECIES: carbohydrate ABC transporter permease [unclassified Bradyrhizobium]|uniref:carbohydrate ABC transporter permease n=1 Tax=unclassified Bradyrhizobium TaxID=2631580 RepID=UPI001BA584F8|nr:MULTISPECIES: carbohydrate ABC transporter permease [unclassified Bradyrhizobium]MBR1223817.1 carbohydrate ABC transporter permease [Bradyrhizobium sp. AUGA SZCCT0176]MBR1237853.1 carbohydrate ABC transporter permease [Bradyrhizobium sp. AUGA SZCCT0182]MBR1285920.1 carbohydrate ABC transporter permease [Bradyrhizobium sp. AUGA SZCCT0177]MBR1301493.1 carbohydrate ABC transporter permease [Bradyrhizobium sp. AUGA SZCCT0042]
MRDRTFAPSRMLIYLVVSLVAAAWLVPLIVVVLNSLRSNEEIVQTSMIGWPRQWAFGNYLTAWSDFCVAQTCVGIRPYMLNSALVTIPATIFSTLLGAVAGYAVSLWRFRGDNWIYGIVTLGIFLPQQMRLLPWTIVLRDTGLMNTLTGLVLIHTIQGLSFTVLFCRNYYVAIPQELIRAARIDGAGFFRIFWRIILPLSPPILVVTVIWQFTHIWNEFLYGVTFTTGQQQPVTAALIALSAAVADIPHHGVQSAAVMIAALPTLLIYLIGGKYFVRGLTAGAVK